MNNTKSNMSTVAASTDEGKIPEWAYYQQLTYSGIVAVLGIPGNILVILAFAFSRERSTTDFMVLSMAVSDLAGSLICTTCTIMRNIKSLWSQIDTAWGCRLEVYVVMLTSGASMWYLSVTAIDRYMKTCRPHSLFFTVKKVQTICIIVFAVMALVSSFATPAVSFDPIRGICSVRIERDWSFVANIMFTVCCLSLLVTTVAYVLVAFALCKRLQKKARRLQASRRLQYLATVAESDVDDAKSEASKTGHKANKDWFKGRDEYLHQEEKRVNRTTTVMFLITAINISTFILVVIGNMSSDEKVRNIHLLTFGYIIDTSHMVNYVTNPILYMIMSSKFRDNVRILLKRH